VVDALVGDHEVTQDAVALPGADQRGRRAREAERDRERGEQVEDRVLAVRDGLVALAHDRERLQRRRPGRLEQLVDVLGLRRQLGRAAPPHARQLDHGGAERRADRDHAHRLGAAIELERAAVGHHPPLPAQPGG